MKRWPLIVSALLVLGSIRCDEEESNGNAEVSEVGIEGIPYNSPVAAPGQFFFAEHFDNLQNFNKRWIRSEAKKEGDLDEELAKYDGVWEVEAPQKQLMKGDLGLVLKSKAKHAAISAKLDKPFVFSDKPLIVQYEVTMQDGQECGGSYIKLLSAGPGTSNLREFRDNTPYSIMFGPDKCGVDSKFHFIFRHTNPLNGSIEEKHCKKPRERFDDVFSDKLPHLYRLVLRPDNTFTITIDGKVVNEGSLLLDFTPPVNPPQEIPDPDDVKPENWDDREKIPDPEAIKPDDWDEDEPAQIVDPSAEKPAGWLDTEEEMIPDPDAVKPADWDTDMDGDWEAPLIPNPACEGAVGCGLWKAPLISNPKYKGKWRAPYITNPNYRGKWAPKMIANPGYFQDLQPFKMAPIAAVGIELWSMSSNLLFDNIVITDNENNANSWADATFILKKVHLDKESESLVTRLLNYTHDRPWLWAIYVVVIGLPIALLLFFCCSGKDKQEEKRAQAKKTDEPTADDSKYERLSRSGSQNLKENLEIPQTDEVVENHEPVGDEEEDSEVEDDEDKDKDDEVIETKPSEAGDAPRKRRTRKE
ncbi:calnexin-like isoform X2 [Ctenocephalides felis]|uniref:calnexin-like isoform X2 n=1 Tax=Ctenocephalides felis TaxID=7515 RepID=UPI000E6E2B00|nr:calnexin-like isoform X2 [Ctenocephalides felis]